MVGQTGKAVRPCPTTPLFKGDTNMQVFNTLSPTLIIALAPLVLIDVGMIVYCIVDLYRPHRRVKGDNKTVWLLVILLVATLGWILYLLVGRED
jgi:hypothetical protein